MEKVKTKRKFIKRLIHGKTIDQIIKSLDALSKEGFGENIVVVDSRISRYGNTYLSTANITINIKK